MGVDLVRNFPFFSIFLAMFSGIVTAPVKRGRLAWRISLSMVCVVTLMSFTLLARVIHTGESFTFMMGHFPAPWGNELKACPLEALMACLFSVVMLLSMLGGRDDVFVDILPEKQNLYFIMLNLLFGAMLALIYTNDLFTAYVFIEISTIAACSLIMAKDSSRSLVATMRYLIMMLLGSGLFLFGVIILYYVTGHLLMEDIARLVAQIRVSGDYDGPMRVLVALIVIGIAVKSALFPFHTMLPGAHSVATPTSSALLSGLVLKCFIILLVKLIFRVFTVEYLAELGILRVLFLFSALGIVICSVQAMAEGDLKRMIAYSSAAQIGYIYLGLSLSEHGGATVACFHIIAHALAKSMLFICAGGLIDASGHTTNIHMLRGAAYRNRLAGVGFTLGGLSLIGVPLLPGFVSKLYLATAAMHDSLSLILVLLALVASMVLNAVYFMPAIIAIWSRPEADAVPPQAQPVSLAFRLSVCTSIALNLALGVGFRPVLALIEKGISLL